MTNAGRDMPIGKGDSTYIGRSKETGLECTWTLLGSSAIIGTAAGIWVKPTVATSYVVTQTLCGVTKKDTVRVEVWGVGVNSVRGQSQEYSLVPNPNDGHFMLMQSVPNDGLMQVEISNVVGQIVFRATSNFSSGSASISTGNTLQPGLYYLSLKDAQGQISILRFLKY